MDKINILSHRAQDILSAPKYRSFDKNDDTWTITIENSGKSKIENDKILTLSYFPKSDRAVELLFCETLARLSVQKKIGTLIDLGHREIESFLRDENHLPVFNKNDLEEVQLIFNDVKNELIFTVIKERLREEVSDHRFLLSKAWSNNTLVEKNRAVFSSIELMNSFFPEEKHMKLVLVDPSQIFINKGKFPLELAVIEDVLKELLGPLGPAPLKVVAVQ